MDSGCTTPILNDASLFRTLHPSTAQVRTADKKIINMQHEGPADIVVIDEKGAEHNVHLPRAFLCTTMHTLLSVKQLVRQDHDVNFSNKGSSLGVNGAKVPLHLRDNLYQLRYRRRRAQDAAAYAHQTPTRYVVELCAGTSSAVKYHLLDDPHAVGLSIDLRSNEFLLKHVPPNLHARFTPVGSTDVEHLTYEKLADIVRKAWNISLDQVDVIHHSPMCQSLSGATHDRTNHFTPDKITPITTLA